MVVEYRTKAEVVRALDDVSLSIGIGETIGIVGESGSGKSTLGLALTRLLPPNAHCVAGDIVIDGGSVYDLTDRELRMLRRNRVAVVFQKPANSLDPTMQIGRQLADVSAGATVTDLLRQVGLKDATRIARSYPHEISGGMAQRVAIAMAICTKPAVIIADEPTASLDSSVRGQILDLLFGLRDRDGASMIFLTHDLFSVARFCDRVAVMYGGRFVEIGARDRVLDSPRHPYTRALLAALPGAQRTTRLSAIPGLPPVLHERSECCAFAPRCQIAVGLCTSRRPEARVVAGREVVCHRAHEEVVLELTGPGARVAGQ